MTATKPVPCIPDDGIHAYIPDAAVSMMAFVSAYHRLNGDTEVLQTGFQLEPWQFHAAMAYYFANKELFDAEHKRVMDEQQKWLMEFREKNKDKNGWAEICGIWGGSRKGIGGIELNPNPYLAPNVNRRDWIDPHLTP